MADEPFREWIGREEVRTDVVTPGPLARLAATLDHRSPPWGEGVLPPLGHWLFHLPDAAQSDLGEDGHPARGGFLPPISQPRRMWVGGALRFLASVRVGETIVRRSRIAAIAVKPGAAGEMVLVTLRHEIGDGGSVAIEEDQVLAYLPAGAAARPAAEPDPVEAESLRTIVSDPALLFRFSALTFNAHRIHYDLAYAQGVEAYPGLVVQGPLQAMLLADHYQRDAPGQGIAAFAFRARAPLFAGAPADLCRAGDDLWVRDAQGRTTMTAKVTPR